MNFIFSEEPYTYHIKDEYFEMMGNNLGLMSNKENGKFRPNYYAVKEQDSEIVWMIPLSSQHDKYKKIYDNKIKKHGECLNFVFGKYSGKKSVFLLQNMFPVLFEHIDHVHTINGQPLKIHKKAKEEIEYKFKKIMQKRKVGIIIPFTKIDELYNKVNNQVSSLKQEVAIDLEEK